MKFTEKLLTVAVIVIVPVVLGKVYIVLATPWALVMGDEFVKLPPAPLSVKFTDTFGTGFPY